MNEDKRNGEDSERRQPLPKSQFVIRDTQQAVLFSLISDDCRRFLHPDSQQSSRNETHYGNGDNRSTDGDGPEAGETAPQLHKIAHPCTIPRQIYWHPFADRKELFPLCLNIDSNHPASDQRREVNPQLAPESSL